MCRHLTSLRQHKLWIYVVFSLVPSHKISQDVCLLTFSARKANVVIIASSQWRTYSTRQLYVPVFPAFFKAVVVHRCGKSISAENTFEVLIDFQGVQATFLFTRKSDASELACIHGTLSNGLTSQSHSKTWIFASFALFFFIFTIIFRIIRDGPKEKDVVPPPPVVQPNNVPPPPPVVQPNVPPPPNVPDRTRNRMRRWLRQWPKPDPTALFLLSQFLSTTGLLSLDYPEAYLAFSANFAWANFLVPIPSFLSAVASLTRCEMETLIQPRHSYHDAPVVSYANDTVGIAVYARKVGVMHEEDIFGNVLLLVSCAFVSILGLCLLLMVAMKVFRSFVPKAHHPSWVNGNLWETVLLVFAQCLVCCSSSAFCHVSLIVPFSAAYCIQAHLRLRCLSVGARLS